MTHSKRLTGKSFIRKSLAAAVGLAASAALATTAQAAISDGKVVIGYMDDMNGPYSDLAGPRGVPPSRWPSRTSAAVSTAFPSS